MNPFEAAKEVFRSLLEFLHDDVNLTFGWAIVAVTLIVRLLILPLFIKQYRSMRRMQAYAPQIKEIQRKHKGNRQKLNEEMMSFYKENQINPFSSCLPLVAQAPVFIVLYYTLRDFSREAENFPQESLDFMWIVPDVAVDLLDIGWGAIVLLAIYAISQLLASELSMTPATAGNQKWLMRGLPLLIVFFVTTFPVPTGVVIYWVTTNLWTCGQQLVIKRMIGENPYLEEAAAAGAKVGGARTSRTPPKTATAVVADDEATDADRGGNGRAERPPSRPAKSKDGRRRPRTAPPGAGGSGAPETPSEDAAEPPPAPASGTGANGAPGKTGGGAGKARSSRRPPPQKKKPRGAAGGRRQPKKRR